MTVWSRFRASFALRRTDWLALGLLLTLGVIVPTAFAVASGAVWIPRNDDWVYRRIAAEFADTGLLSLHSVSTMMVGLIVAAQPLLRLVDDHATAFAFAGVGFAIAAVVSAFALARQVLSPWRAALAASLVVVFPGYLAYATSFMTDGPALAAQFTCLALGVRALRYRPVPLPVLVVAAFVGFLGFSIKEFAVAAPAAVLGSALWAQPRRPATWALAIAFGLACALLYGVKLTIPGQVVTGGGGTFANILPAITTVCLVTSPAAILAARLRYRAWTRFDIAVGAEIGLAIAALFLIWSVRDGSILDVFLGNLMSQFGVPTSWYIIGGRPLVFADPAWVVLNLFALVATVITSSVIAAEVGAYFRRCRRSGRSPLSVLGTPVGILLVFVATAFAGLTIFGSRFILFDRYFWPLLPPLATLLMYRPRSEAEVAVVPGTFKRSVALSVTAWLVLLSASLLFMLNSFAFDVARWQGGERLVALGIPPQNVDAGYEWVGEHQPQLPGPNAPMGQEIFYQDWWPGRLACGIVGGSPPEAGAVTVGVVPWNLFLIGGPPERLYLYRRPLAGCTP